jgi:hypothetical protein
MNRGPAIRDANSGFFKCQSEFATRFPSIKGLDFCSKISGSGGEKSEEGGHQKATEIICAHYSRVHNVCLSEPSDVAKKLELGLGSKPGDY